MVERIWDSSGFYARIGSSSSSQDSAADGSNWRELYRAALLELDLEKLGDRIKAAAEAIRARASLDRSVLNAERIAMRDAMSALNVLHDGIKRTKPPISDSGF